MTTETETETRAAIAAERAELGELLAGLPAQRWDEPSLCAGWRVREVVAHLTMPFRYSGGQILRELLREGFRMNRMLDRCARRDAARLSPADLTGALLDNVDHPWRPPGGGYAGALTHDVVHGLDITVALGLDRRVPADRLAPVLTGLANQKGLKYFGVDLAGVRLVADDLDFGFGTGSTVTGSAGDLALVLTGRRLPTGRLRGAAADRFTR